MKRLAVPAGIFALLMAIYVWTMAPGNFWLDSPAFAACNDILGLPHSPSFPIYTILGRVMNLVLPGTPARVGNMYSAVTSALGGVVAYLILIQLLSRLKITASLKQVAAVSGSAYAYLTVPVWQSAVRTEIYSLQLLLTLLVVYLFLKTLGPEAGGRKLKYALGAVFVQGLSLANHSLLAMVTMPLVAALPFLLWRTIPRASLFKTAMIAVVVFAVAVSSYLFLPIRAAQNPAINSGRPTSLAATFKAITRVGEDYLPNMPSPQVNYGSRAVKLIGFASGQMGILLLAGIVLALFLSLRKKLADVLMVSSMIPIGLLITIWAADFRLFNYDIVAYSGIALVAAVIVGFVGLGLIVEKYADRKRVGQIACAVCVLIVFLDFSGNLYSSDLSKTDGPDRLAGMILSQAPPRAVLICNEDNVLLPLWYQCFALGTRPDVAVISAGALYRPSYREEVRRNYPDLELPPQFDQCRIENLGEAMTSLCTLNAPRRPLLVQFGVPGIAAEQLSPDGFLFRYRDGNTVASGDSGRQQMEILDRIGEGATDLLTTDFVARSAFNFGVYFDRIGQAQTAYRFFQYAIETDETNPEYLLRLGMAFLKAGRNEEAVLLLEQAAKTGDGCPEAEAALARLRDRKYGEL